MNSPIDFAWPELLWSLAVLPLLVLAYVWLLKRRKQAAVRVASLGLLKAAVGTHSAWRRHVPPALFLAAIALMLLALARPQAVIALPSQQQTVILAMDVSGSMRATDVQPNRLVASQEAARAFIAAQPAYTRIGIVSFAATAQLVQPPTRNREDVLAAIDRFQLQRGTATGSGLVVSMATLFPDAGISVDALQAGDGMGRNAGAPLGAKESGKDAARGGSDDAKPVRPGSYSSGVIILLTDGQRTTGPDPLVAARLAADRGVRVYTVGVGTQAGGTIGFEGWTLHVRLDEETLKTIATMTQGEYFYAGSAIDLKKIYQNLNSRIVVESRRTEVTALLAAAAVVLLLVSAALSLLWFHRIV